MKFTLRTALSTLALLLPGLGQAQAPQTFEVVSVKRSNSADDRTASVVQPGGRYSATNVTLRMLVRRRMGCTTIKSWEVSRLLGLKLESQRSAVEVLVVESAERPQPD